MGADQAVMRAIRDRLRRGLRSEQGIALPTALFATLASFALAAVAVVSTVDAQHGTTRDHDTKEAIAAADAGASVALARLNRFHSRLSTSHRCVGTGGEWLAESTQYPGWCPATAAETVGNGTYSYRVSSSSGTGSLEVVSTGTAGSVSRRVEVGMISYAGEKVFGEDGMIGQKNIVINGEKAKLYSDLGTNGSIKVNENAPPTICGDLRHGSGGTGPNPERVCPGGRYESTESEKLLPPVVAPEGIETSNSNCRLEVNSKTGESNCLIKTEVDTYSKKRTTTTPWDPATSTINLEGEARLTLGGRNYYICQLKVSGSAELIMAANAEVHIYFKPPEKCPGIQNGGTQVSISGGGKVVSTGYNPAEGHYSLLQLYLIGSQVYPTSVYIGGESGTNEMMIYAPYSEIKIAGSAKLIGFAAGQSMTIEGEPRIESPKLKEPPGESYSSLWQRAHYIECSAGTGATPDANC